MTKYRGGGGRRPSPPLYFTPYLAKFIQNHPKRASYRVIPQPSVPGRNFHGCKLLGGPSGAVFKDVFMFVVSAGGRKTETAEDFDEKLPAG